MIQLINPLTLVKTPQTTKHAVVDDLDSLKELASSVTEEANKETCPLCGNLLKRVLANKMKALACVGCKVCIPR